MAISEAYTGTKADLGSTEWSLTGNEARAAQAVTDGGVYQAVLDLSDMVFADVVEIRVYEKATSGGTQRVAYLVALAGVQPEPLLVLPSLILLHGWDVTAKATAGEVSISWSIRKVA